MKCKCCETQCIRKGIHNGNQQYYCGQCKKYQRLHYRKRSVTKDQHQLLIKLNNEGVGIRGIGRILNIAASSVVRRIKAIAQHILAPVTKTTNDVFEIDELQTYVGKNIPSNYIWVTYAINRKTRSVIDFIVGKRTKENLKIITDKVRALKPRCVYTDGLAIYRNLIDKEIHKVRRFKINHIERKNLTLRTHLKRLNRRTICFSKSAAMLHACLMLYFYS